MAAAPPFLCPCGGILRGMHGGWELLFRRADRSLSGNFCRGVAGQRGKKVQSMDLKLALLFFVEKCMF